MAEYYGRGGPCGAALEYGYASLENCAVDETRAMQALTEIRASLEKHNF